MHWFAQNYQWLFDGVGGAVLVALAGWGYNRWKKSRSQAVEPRTSATLTAQGAKVTNSPVASGSNISQNINSPTLNVSLPAAPASGTPGRERYDEWPELIDEIHGSVEQMGYAFMPLVAVKAGDERNDYQAGIRRGNRVLHNRIFTTEAIEKSGLIHEWDDLVQYAHAGRGPGDRREQRSPTMGGFDAKARSFQEKLMKVARDDMNAPLHKVRSDACNFWLQFHPQGSRPLMIQNSGDEAGFDVVAKIPADGSGFTSDLINRLENDRSWVPCLSKGSFMHLEAMRRVLAETVLRGSEGDNPKTIPVLVSYRTQSQGNCECRLEIRLPLKDGIQFALPEK